MRYHFSILFILAILLIPHTTYATESSLVCKTLKDCCDALLTNDQLKAKFEQKCKTLSQKEGKTCMEDFSAIVADINKQGVTS